MIRAAVDVDDRRAAPGAATRPASSADAAARGAARRRVVAHPARRPDGRARRSGGRSPSTPTPSTPSPSAPPWSRPGVGGGRRPRGGAPRRRRRDDPAHEPAAVPGRPAGHRRPEPHRRALPRPRGRDPCAAPRPGRRRAAMQAPVQAPASAPAAEAGTGSRARGPDGSGRPAARATRGPGPTSGWRRQRLPPAPRRGRPRRTGPRWPRASRPPSADAPARAPTSNSRPARRAPHCRARRTPAEPHGSPGCRTAAPRHPDDRDAQAGRHRSAGRLEAHPHRRDRRRGPARARRPRRRRGDLPALRPPPELPAVCPAAARGLSRVARRYLDRDDPDAINPPTPGCPKRMVFGPGLRRGPRRRVLRAGRRPPVPVVRPVRAGRDPVVAGAGTAAPAPDPAPVVLTDLTAPPYDLRATRAILETLAPVSDGLLIGEDRLLPDFPPTYDRGGDPRRGRRPVDHPDLPRPQPRRARAGARGARRARRRRGPLRHR